MPMDLSVVATLYRSQPYIEEFYRRICAAASAITPDFELILVNDGSPDGSLEAAVALYQRDERVRVIDLSRNFGHHRAIMTGLGHALGDLVFLIDCDLEEEPELLSRFHARLVETGADVIYGTQVSRKGGIWERISGAVFYKVFRALSSAPVPKNLVTVRLMTRRYVHALVQHRDREIFLAGLWQITGFQQVALPIVKLWRRTSSYSWRHKVAILVNAVTSFSTTPLVWIFYVGIAMLLVIVRGGTLPDRSEAFFRHVSVWMAVADRLHMDDRRLHDIFHRDHWDLSFEDLRGDEGPTIHNHPRGLPEMRRATRMAKMPDDSGTRPPFRRMYDSGEGGMKRLVIFGAGHLARIAQFYFSRDSEYEVAAFTVHERFVQSEEYGGLPLVGFETVEEWYGPDEFEMFVAVGYKQLNRVRAEVYRAAKKKNYRLATYVSSKAVYFGDVNCGDNCFILEANVIQPFVKIGNDVVLWSGNHIGHDVVIEDHCFVSSHVVLSGHVRVGRVLVPRRECLHEGRSDDWRELPDRSRCGDSQRYEARVGAPGEGHARVAGPGGKGRTPFDTGTRQALARTLWNG